MAGNIQYTAGRGVFRTIIVVAPCLIPRRFNSLFCDRPVSLLWVRGSTGFVASDLQEGRVRYTLGIDG